MATLLLDTCALLWATGEPQRLGATAREQVASPNNRVLVSYATLWKLSIKVGLGKVDLPSGFFDKLSDLGYEKLPINDKHLAEYRKLPLHHRDPFDRMLVAQSRAEQIPLASNDPEICKYRVKLVW